MNEEKRHTIEALISQKLVDEADYIDTFPRETGNGIQYMERRYIKRGEEGQPDIYQFTTKLSSLVDREIVGKPFYASDNDSEDLSGSDPVNGEAYDNAFDNLKELIEAIAKI